MCVCGLGPATTEAPTTAAPTTAAPTTAAPTTAAPTTAGPCPPEQIPVNNYIQAGAYYFHQTTNEVTGDNAEAECTVLDLTWVDVNSAEQVQRLMQADLGKYIGASVI